MWQLHRAVGCGLVYRTSRPRFSCCGPGQVPCNSGCVHMCVPAGDLPVFSQLLGDGDTRTPFKGPAALIGLDVLAQRRVVLEAIPPALARTVGRKRRLFVAKK